MIEVLLLALALSMDAFAVSLTLGIRHPDHINKMAVIAGLYFGVFQGAMPLIGYFGGVVMLDWLGDFTHWIAFLLLTLIGLKMIFEAAKTNSEDKAELSSYSHHAMLLLAIATSIDALAAGFSLSLMDVNGLLACLIIGFVTFLFSYIGVKMGKKTSRFIGNKAEFLGGIVLVLLAIKVVIT